MPSQTFFSRRQDLVFQFVTGMAVVLLAGLGFWLRVDGARTVVLPEGSPARLLGTDAYDHLRRAAELTGTLSADTAPRPVSAADWVRPGLFDAAIGLPAVVREGTHPSLTALTAGAVWVPPVLAALSILALYALARRFLPPIDSWLTTLLFVLYPGESLDRTTLGFADHHAAEILLTLLTLWGVVHLLQSPEDRPSWHPALLAGAPAAMLTLVWRGAALTLTLLAVGLALTILTDAGREGQLQRLIRRSWRYAWGLIALLALVGVFLPALQLGPVTTRRVWIAAVALLAVPALGLATARLQRTALGRTAAWVVIGGVTLAAVVALSTGPGARVASALSTARTANVQEHVAPSALTILESLGGLALLAVPGLVLGVFAVGRRRLDGALLLPYFLAASWTFIWWRIHDVGYLPPALLALPAGCTLWWLRSWLLRGVGRGVAGARSALRTTLSAVPLLVLAVAPLWPYGLSDPPATSAARARALLAYTPATIEAATWLRDNTPEHRPVASPWALGNLVASLGERQPLWARMPSRSAGAWLLARTEEDSVAMLAAMSGGEPVSHAVIDGRSCGSYFVSAARDTGTEPELVASGVLEADSREIPLWRFGETYEGSLAARLCFGEPSHLKRYRLRWESSSRVVTAYRMDDFEATASRRRVRLETRSLAPGEALPPPDEVQMSVDGRSIVYGHRAHAELRIFELAAPASSGADLRRAEAQRPAERIR